MNTNLIRDKAIQNLTGVAINLWEVLIEDPENTRSIITVEKWIGSRSLKDFNLRFTSGYGQAVLRKCDQEVLAKSCGFNSFAELKKYYH
jgi:hypothetical protein